MAVRSLVPEAMGTADAHAAFAALIQHLSNPQAFARVEAGLSAPAEVVQTHASAVLLTPKRAYKLKKPEDLGFLDYSTPQLRRHFCQLEVRLNTHLAPGIYLGVAAIIRLADGGARFTRIYHVDEDEVPLPGDAADGGVVIDYAVVMVRVPEDATLDALVRSGHLTPKLVAEVARFVAAFHSSARTDEQISRFGTLEVVRANWEENLDQMRPYVGRTLTQATNLRITRYIRAFMERRADLFRARVRNGRIRDCHGDLRLQHVYRLGKRNSRPRLAILDCIEFNERFRCGDVASEIAFLAMELTAAGRADLARAFVQAYIAASGDAALQEMLPFYLCYRACVRGKVTSFLLDQPEVADAEREAATHQAATFFELAARYAAGPTHPVLVLVGGVMGTGKSTIAAALHTALGWSILSSDMTRKRLAGLDPAAPQDTPFERGIYSPEFTQRTYQALQQEADALLREGHAEIVDASFSRQRERDALLSTARERRTDALFVECVAPRDVVLARLAARWRRRSTGSGRPGVTDALGASDGRPELYDLQRARWEPVPSDRTACGRHIRLDTSQAEARCVEQVLDTLDVPRLACWLT
jgi:uncharacterized protein